MIISALPSGVWKCQTSNLCRYLHKTNQKVNFGFVRISAQLTPSIFFLEMSKEQLVRTCAQLTPKSFLEMTIFAEIVFVEWYNYKKKRIGELIKGNVARKIFGSVEKISADR